MVACHLFAADAQASFTDTAESRTRAFDVPAWVVLVEATRADAAERVRSLVASTDLGSDIVIRDDAAVYTVEICRLADEPAPGADNR